MWLARVIWGTVVLLDGFFGAANGKCNFPVVIVHFASLKTLPSFPSQLQSCPGQIYRKVTTMRVL